MIFFVHCKLVLECEEWCSRLSNKKLLRRGLITVRHVCEEARRPEVFFLQRVLIRSQVKELIYKQSSVFAICCIIQRGDNSTVTWYPYLSYRLSSISYYNIGPLVKDGLEDAITYNRGALALRPLNHPDRSSSLINLAHAPNDRYDWLGRWSGWGDQVQTWSTRTLSTLSTWSQLSFLVP